jgi:hypothetical protein
MKKPPAGAGGFLWERLSAAMIAAGCRSHRSNRVLQNKHQAVSQTLATCRD